MVPASGSHGTEGCADQNTADGDQRDHRYEPSQGTRFPCQQTAAAFRWLFGKTPSEKKNKQG